MTETSPPPASTGAGRVRQLTAGEQAAVAGVGAAVAGLGLIGFANSFAKVAAAARPWFGPLAPTVPLGIDLGILAFSALDLLLARLDMRPRWLRLIPWGLTAATVYLNISGEPSAFAKIAHAVFPLLWVTAVEVGAHVTRIWAGLAAGTAMDRIRPARWILAPLRTAGLWRRMVLWEIRSYPLALERERDRLLTLTALQDRHGRIAWRWRAPRRARALYRLGEHAPVIGPDRTDPARMGGAAGTDAGDRTGGHGGEGDNAGRTGLPVTQHPTPAALPAGRAAGRGEAAGIGVDRAALVAELASQIRTADAAGRDWRPDYDALMNRTGYRRSWCEKAVRAAREAARTTHAPAPSPSGQPARTDGISPAAADAAARTDGADVLPADAAGRTDRVPVPDGEAA